MRPFLIAVLLLAPLAAPAEVYKWVDEKGVVHYTDKPPKDGTEPAKLPPLQTYKGGQLPKSLDKPATGKKAPARSVELTISSPTPDQTFRSAERRVPVSVSVSPALGEGHKFIYFLDGQPQALPTTSSSFTFEGVERGSHQISISVVDESGREVGRAAPVTIHMKPPTVTNERSPTEPDGTRTMPTLQRVSPRTSEGES